MVDLNDLYVCGLCGRTLQSVRSHLEAAIEFVANYPLEARHNDPRVVVCDDCYRGLPSVRRPLKS